MAEQNQYFNLLALPKDIIGLIFNKLDVIEEIGSHHCIAKWWNETYWSTLTSVRVDSRTPFGELEDRHLKYIFSRVNLLRLYSLDLLKKAPELTLSSLSLLSQFINLKFLRLNGITKPDLIRQTVTSLISLSDLDMRAIGIDDNFRESIADNLPKLTRLTIVESGRLQRWPNAYKLTNLNELTLALIIDFSANGYADIAKLSNVTLLNVNANSIDNESLKHILSMTNLEVLIFMHAKVTLPSAYSGLVNMTKLQRLEAHILPDDETLSYLSQAYSLTTLRVAVRQRAISAKFISPLTNLKQLTGVKMKDTHLLTTLTNLEQLNSVAQNISEEFPLQVMTNLKVISVNAIESKTFQKFQSLVKLKSLLVNSKLDSQESDFDGIQYCQNLQTLGYSGPQISVQQFGYITQCTQLVDLYIDIPNECADNFSKLTQLTSLEVRGPDWKIEHFQKLTILTKLKYLTISNNESLQTREDEMAIQNLFSPDVRTDLIVSAM